jgi:hypothetical protein
MQKIVFDCSSELGTNDYGTLLLLSENAPYEAIADVRSYHYHFIYGKYKDGYYISIPDWYIGCPMSHYKDVRWNTTSLIAAGMGPGSAGIVAIALSHLMEAYQKNRMHGSDPVIQVLEDSKKSVKTENDDEPDV